MDFAANLDGCGVFSKIDLIKEYHQVPGAEQDIKKTAITNPFGLYEFLRMPFGVRNAPLEVRKMWFQRAEAQFRLRGISDETTMADHAISAMSE
jgi:hypothetical protein